MIAESKQLGIRIQQTQKKLWLERYAGQEVSLLIEVIDSKELGITPGQPPATRPTTVTKWGQTNANFDQPKRTKVSFEEKEKKKEFDILSSDEDFTSVKGSSQLNSLTSSKKALASRLEDIVEYPRERKLVSKSKKEAQESKAAPKSRPFSAKASGDPEKSLPTTTNSFTPQDDSYFGLPSVTYQWAIQTQTTPESWKDLAFNLNYQVEEFYTYIYNNYNKRTEVF